MERNHGLHLSTSWNSSPPPPEKRNGGHYSYYTWVICGSLNQGFDICQFYFGVASLRLALLRNYSVSRFHFIDQGTVSSKDDLLNPQIVEICGQNYKDVDKDV